MIILILLAAPLAEAARIFGFNPFSLDSDDQVKDTTSSYRSVEDRTRQMAALGLNECSSRRATLEKHPGSEGSLKPNVSAKSKVSDQRSDELLRTILPSLKFNVVSLEVKKNVPPFEPLGHSPGIGHDDPPGARH